MDISIINDWNEYCVQLKLSTNTSVFIQGILEYAHKLGLENAKSKDILLEYIEKRTSLITKHKDILIQAWITILNNDDLNEKDIKILFKKFIATVSRETFTKKIRDYLARQKKLGWSITVQMKTTESLKNELKENDRLHALESVAMNLKLVKFEKSARDDQRKVSLLNDKVSNYADTIMKVQAEKSQVQAEKSQVQANNSLLIIENAGLKAEKLQDKAEIARLKRLIIENAGLKAEILQDKVEIARLKRLIYDNEPLLDDNVYTV
jgi:hypothetical protein